MSATPAKGPDGYENWRAAIAGAEARGSAEVCLYTDADITGHLPATPPCPYSFLNSIAFRRRDLLVPAVVLRVTFHLDGELPTMDRTDTSRFHGGTLDDEIAVLVSLAMGIRVRPGGITRTFYDSDPAGSPRADSDVPVLPPPQYPHAPRIPNAKSSKNLNKQLLRLLALYPQLSTAHAVTLVRAARLYRDGLWVVESDPQLAWLFFVAAVEAVATPFHVQTVEAVPLFREAHRDLADLLQKTGGDALVEQVATSLLRMMRATGRFIDFTLRYLPPPMDPRPPETLQVKWEPPRMKKALRQIYEYRSRALHDGTPFPPPMSQPESIPTEIPTGLASATMGGVWMSEDTPMLIHVFEHIVRGALLNWWHDASRAG